VHGAAVVEDDATAVAPFVDAYRTLCQAPESECRKLLEDVCHLRLVASACEGYYLEKSELAPMLAVRPEDNQVQFSV